MNYQEALGYLESLQVYGSKLGLDNIRYLCKKLGNPEQNLKVIHVAGTNGKGSVCAMASAILREARLKVGRYISPHLLDFRERIVINDKEIPEHEVAKYIEKLKPIAEEMDRHPDLTHPTYFEIVTAMALKHFAVHKVDYAVVEVGLGGRLDATNVVKPEVCVITNISLEHTGVLGNTIAKIAKEKAGIIKEDAIVVTSAGGEALEVIKQIAAEKSSEVIDVTEPYKWDLALKGEFERMNAAVAIEAVRQLGLEVPVERTLIEAALRRVQWPGRMQKIGNILLDCAHNPAGIRVLVNSLNTYPRKKLILVFGCLSDKDHKKMLSALEEIADTIILTQPQNERAISPHDLHLEVPGSTTTEHIAEALKHAQDIAQADDLILVTGSCYVVGEALRVLSS
jgi:dihydrofolate synthase/folylpolyglutamate synthase